MTSILSYLFYFIATSVASIQQRWLSTKKEGGSKIDFSFKVSFVSSFLALSLIFVSPFSLKGSPLTIILLALGGGIAGAIYYISYFTAQRYVEAGVTSVLRNIYTPVTIVLSTLFLGEGLKGFQIVGTILLLISAVIVSKKHRVTRFVYDRYFWLMIFSGVWLSILLVSARELMKITGFTASIILSWWSICICLGIIVLCTKGVTTYTKKEIAITGFLKFFQDLSWSVLTFFVANLSLVSAITTFKIVVVFVMAAVVLKEREDVPRKIFGSLVAVAGLLLMR